MATSVAAASVIGVGGGAAGEAVVGPETCRAGGDALEVIGLEFIADPERGFVNGTVAEGEELTIGELAVGTGAGGVGAFMRPGLRCWLCRTPLGPRRVRRQTLKDRQR